MEGKKAVYVDQLPQKVQLEFLDQLEARLFAEGLDNDEINYGLQSALTSKIVDLGEIGTEILEGIMKGVKK